MNAQADSTRALVRAAAVGTALQVGMVLVGHTNAAVADLFAVLGMSFSLVAGLLYAVWARGISRGRAAGGGAVAGGACALIGILISYLLGDVPAAVLAFGTASSVVTGALGGVVGQLVAGRSAARA